MFTGRFHQQKTRVRYLIIQSQVLEYMGHCNPLRDSEFAESFVTQNPVKQYASRGD